MKQEDVPLNYSDRYELQGLLQNLSESCYWSTVTFGMLDQMIEQMNEFKERVSNDNRYRPGNYASAEG